MKYDKNDMEIEHSMGVKALIVVSLIIIIPSIIVGFIIGSIFYTQSHKEHSIEPQVIRYDPTRIPERTSMVIDGHRVIPVFHVKTRPLAKEEIIRLYGDRVISESDDIRVTGEVIEDQ